MARRAVIVARDLGEVPDDLAFPYTRVSADAWKDKEPPDLPTINFAPGVPMGLGDIAPGQRVSVRVHHAAHLERDDLAHEVSAGLANDLDLTLRIDP
ncbi:MAG TPA: hypothetical protein VN672_05775 [Solirubrobacteraceae bacterium]|nr:hypothetical protein [Solirubrobacteraceae bacterium]